MFDPADWPVIRLTLLVGAISVGVSLVPGILLGWLFARWNHPLRALAQGITMLPLVLPPVVTGYLLLMLLGRKSWLGASLESITGLRIAFSTTACVVAAAVVGFPLLVESIRLSILGMDQRLESVSRSLGRSRLQTFLRVNLPLCLPGILSGAVLSFARALGEFGATIVLAGDIEGTTRTIPLAVYGHLYAVDGEAAAGRLVLVSVLISLVALMAAAWLQQRQRRRMEDQK
ncbi:MAG: molybdate ABC transporter permease subunit [Planctomycetes bacterium]|nr:molybdate ABC transporter permease subunit [Planctomycetota bacterium]